MKAILEIGSKQSERHIGATPITRMAGITIFWHFYWELVRATKRSAALTLAIMNRQDLRLHRQKQLLRQLPELLPQRPPLHR